MKVVLIKDVKNLGFAGDVVEVAAGFGRNKLLPKGFAKPATAGTLQQAEAKRATRIKSHEEILSKAEEISAALQNLTLNFSEKTSEEGHLYGSITEADIAAALKKEARIDLEKNKIELAAHIKTVGSHEAVVHLPNGAKVPVKIQVTALVEKKTAAKKAKK